MTEVIQSLWIGGRLSTLERLCIASFLQNGHQFHLYTYGEVSDVPNGTTILDGRTIVPEDKVFANRSPGIGFGSHAAFSDLFRMELLRQRGGWWVDTDVVCVRPFDFKEPEIIATSWEGQWGDLAVGCVWKAQPGSAFVERCLQHFGELDLSTIGFLDTGPQLLQHCVKDSAYPTAPHAAFCPISWRHVPHLVRSELSRLWFNTKRAIKGGEPVAGFSRETRAVHLWNQLWTVGNLSRDATYARSSVYERLKRRYGIQPSTR